MGDRIATSHRALDSCPRQHHSPRSPLQPLQRHQLLARKRCLDTPADPLAATPLGGARLKKSSAMLSIVLFAMGMVIAAPSATPPALADVCINPQANGVVDAKATATGGLDAVQAYAWLGGADAPYYTSSTKSSHWVGIENNDSGQSTSGYLVQTGWSIDGIGSSYTYRFFYEFYPDQNATDITSWVETTWGGTPDAGDKVYFHLWYHDGNSWGLQVGDITKGWNAAKYIYNNGRATLYKQKWGILATEAAWCGNPQYRPFNDGQITWYDPEAHYNNVWYSFHTSWPQYTSNMADPDGDGHTLETASTVDAYWFANDIWVQYD